MIETQSEQGKPFNPNTPWKNNFTLLSLKPPYLPSQKLRIDLVAIFKNFFLFLKTKNTKNMFGEGGVFLFFFCILYIIENHFF